MDKKIIIGLFVLMLSAASVFAASEGIGQEEGIELDKIITLGSSVLATILFVLSAAAYKRDKRQRLFFVSLAFLLFALKGYLSASELIMPEMEWIDPAASFIDFGILLSFFAGIIKK